MARIYEALVTRPVGQTDILLLSLVALNVGEWEGYKTEQENSYLVSGEYI